MIKKEYEEIKLEIARFVIDQSLTKNISDEKIARMLSEISLSYLPPSRG